MTIGLFEWEVQVLETNAKRFSIPLRLKPNFIMLDDYSKKLIATMWDLDHDNCPFLSEDNKCKIYEDRPLVCQTYPLVAIGLLKHIDEKSEIPFRLGLGDCPNAAKLPFLKNKQFPIRPSTLFKKLFEVYRSTFLGALRYDGATILLYKYLEQSVRQGIIRPATINKNIIKAILRGSKPIGFFEFLKSNGTISEKDIQREIKSIYNFTIMDLEKMMGKR
jgi:Fe-S-cluster containining protein